MSPYRLDHGWEGPKTKEGKNLDHREFQKISVFVNQSSLQIAMKQDSCRRFTLVHFNSGLFV